MMEFGIFIPFWIYIISHLLFNSRLGSWLIGLSGRMSNITHLFRFKLQIIRLRLIFKFDYFPLLLRRWCSCWISQFPMGPTFTDFALLDMRWGGWRCFASLELSSEAQQMDPQRHYCHSIPKVFHKAIIINTRGGNLLT